MSVPTKKGPGATPGTNRPREDGPPSQRERSPFRPPGVVSPAPKLPELESTDPGVPESVLNASSAVKTVEMSSSGLEKLGVGSSATTLDLSSSGLKSLENSVVAAKTLDMTGSGLKTLDTSKPPAAPPPRPAAAVTPSTESHGLQPLKRESTCPPPPQVNVPATAPPASAHTELLPKLLEELCGRIDRLAQVVDTTAHERQEVIDEAKAVNRNYQKLLDKAIAERDALSRELSDARAQAANDTRKQAQAFTELQRDLERERRDNERKLHDAIKQAKEELERATLFERQLAEALASRDRIAEKVAQVEAALESTVLPLRDRLEKARALEAQTRIELDGARREIAALKLLAGPPPRS